MYLARSIAVLVCLIPMAIRGYDADLDRLETSLRAEGLKAHVFVKGTESFAVWLGAANSSPDGLTELCASARRIARAVVPSLGGTVLLHTGNGVTRCEVTGLRVPKTSLDNLLRRVRDGWDYGVSDGIHV